MFFFIVRVFHNRGCLFIIVGAFAIFHNTVIFNMCTYHLGVYSLCQPLYFRPVIDHFAQVFTVIRVF